MEEDGRTKAIKKGMVTVRVGLEGEDEGGLRRFVVPISHLHHPRFKQLLESAEEVYGYRSSGQLTLPCSVDDFLHLRWLIERESQQSSDHSRRHSFSRRSC